MSTPAPMLMLWSSRNWAANRSAVVYPLIVIISVKKAYVSRVYFYDTVLQRCGTWFPVNK